MALDIGFVGVSSAAPGSGEETACYLVNGRILIDTGWNAAIGLQAFGAQPTDLDAVLVTHCHQAGPARPALRQQDAARVAKEAGASVLALVHCSTDQGATALAAAKETFPNARLARRGQRLQVLGSGQAAWI